MMIEQKYASGFVDTAADILERMKETISSTNVEFFLDTKIVDALRKGRSSPEFSAKSDHIEEKIIV